MMFSKVLRVNKFCNFSEGIQTSCGEMEIGIS